MKKGTKGSHEVAHIRNDKVLRMSKAIKIKRKKYPIEGEVVGS